MPRTEKLKVFINLSMNAIMLFDLIIETRAVIWSWNAVFKKKKTLSFFHWSMNAILYSEHDPRVTSHQSSGRHSSVDESWCGFQPGHAQCVASGRSGVTATAAAADHYANPGAGRPTDWQHSSGARLNFRGSRSNADSRRRPTNQGGRGHRTDAYNLKILARELELES